MTQVETDPTAGMSEAELAKYYTTTGDLSGFDFEHPVMLDTEKQKNLDISISVRFTQEQMAAVRQQAEAAGVKVTAYIRQRALSQGLFLPDFDQMKASELLAWLDNCRLSEQSQKPQ